MKKIILLSLVFQLACAPLVDLQAPDEVSGQKIAETNKRLSSIEAIQPGEPSASILSTFSGAKNQLSLGQQKVKLGEVPQGIDACAWASIQTQIKMGKYKAYSDGAGGYESANLGQGFQIAYGADGMTSLRPRNKEAADYQIGLRLSGIGYGDVQERLEAPKGVLSEALDKESGSKVTYQWSETLTEWWVNDGRGLEQWFYIKQAPKGKKEGNPLRLSLALATDMEVSQRGNKLHLRKGSSLLTYEKLKVWDATGRELPAQMHWQTGQLDLLIEDEEAIYPLLIDPTWSQQAYLKASNTDAFDTFGWSVAISGETIVVAAIDEDSNATGVNGNESDNSANGAGAVYVFVRSGTVWTQQAYLKASNTGGGDSFGQSVAISGETIVVGARREDSNATGVNGNGADNSANSSGAAYVFIRSGGLFGTWAQQAYLKASNTDGGDLFGNVAISGETIVVGANFEDSNATGVNGNQVDNSETFAGATYVFIRSGTVWTQQAYLKASNTGGGDQFGGDVAISGETIVVVANFEDSNATGVNGNESDNSAGSAGAAYVFIRSGTVWTQQAYLKASNTDADDQLGYSVAISGETIVVGALDEESNATGVNGNESDNSVSSAGAAYVFIRSGTVWTQQAYLKASNTGGGDFFGISVAISGETIVVGAPGEESNATGVNGNQTDNSAGASGAAYVFIRSGTVWTQQAYLKASNTGSNDQFGWDVAISGTTFVVRASQEESNATGVNGNEVDNSETFAGATYVFEIAYLVDLSLSASPLSNTASEGEYQTYVITLNNAGPDVATGAKVRVQIPANRSYISAIPSVGSYDPQSEIWDVGTVVVGNETLTITFRVD